MRIPALSTIFVLALTSLGNAQDFEALELQCANETMSTEDRIAACTALIDQAAYTDLEDYAVAHYRRGLAYQENGDLEGASEDLDIALDYDRYNYLAYVARGDVLLRLGDAYRAIADFTVAAGLEPLEPDPYVKRAIALQAHREYAQAVDDLRFAIQLDEQHRRARRVLAWLLSTSPQVGLRNGAEAINLTSEIDQDSAAVPDLMILAAVLAEAGDIPSSMEVYTAILERDAGARSRFERYLSTAGYLSTDASSETALPDAIHSCLEAGCRIGAPRPEE